jgi:hypothetical protein
MIAITAPTASESYACSCVPSGPPCQEAWSVDVIFAGTVLSIEPIERETRPGTFQPQLVKFSLERTFLGASLAEAEIVTNPGNTCDYRFYRGGKYLVYARKIGSRLFASICSRTRSMDEAKEDVRYLATIGSAPTGGRLYGRVRERRGDPAEEGGVDYGPVEGITVSVRGDTFVRDVVTDANGTFDVTGLPVGKATLTSVAPFGYEPATMERAVEITHPRGCREVNLWIEQAARVSGVVVDASGRPVAGIEVDAVAAELAGYALPPYQRPVKTDEDGVFEFGRLPPGAYVFGVNLTKTPGPKGTPLYLPGTRLAVEATVIELRAGDRRDVGVLRLTER